MKFMEQELMQALSAGFQEHVRIKMRRPNLYQVFCPFYHSDGDMMNVYVSRQGDSFLIQDMGTTLMHLSYDFDLNTDNKRKLFQEILANYMVQEETSNLYLIANSIEELFPTVMQLITVITKVSDLNFLKKETIKSLFYEMFDTFIVEKFEKHNLVKNWQPEFDKKQEYLSPYAFVKDSKKPVSIFPILNDDRCSETTIILLKYETAGVQADSIAVFEDQTQINRKRLAQLSDTVGKQFSSFEMNQEKIEKYISSELAR